MSIKHLIVYFLFTSVVFSCKNRFFRASSGSMENTIMVGQHFYVQPAKEFNRNDIVVFDYFGNDYNSPAEEPGKFNMRWEKRVYRLIAYSGDKIEIKKGDVFVNDRLVAPPKKALLYYEVLSTVSIDDPENKNLSSAILQKRGDTLVYQLFLSMDQAHDYESRKPAIISVRRANPSHFNDNDTAYAKGSKAGNWSIDNYGPLTIPAPGETIQIDADNFKVYKNIPEAKPGSAVLKEKLYFVMGDNRYGAEDSRFIGLIPHSKMYGIAK